MIKILHVHTLPVISGSGINTFLTMQGLNHSPYQIELACAPHGRLIDLVQSHGMQVHVFKNLVQPVQPLRDLLMLFQLTRFLKQNKFHIVHTHNSKAGFIGRWAARRAGVPVIVHTVHGFAFHAQESFWRQILFRNLERLAKAWCDKIIFISQPLIDWARSEKVIGPDDELKISKIYSGIELEHFQPVPLNRKHELRKKWGLFPDHLVIGVVSKLWDGKGHKVLIAAFAGVLRQIKNARLVIVGEGYLYHELQDWVTRFGLQDTVVFAGFQMDVAEMIATFDIAVLPSFFEGMGRVLLEAMAMEKPVVASRVGGIPDLVNHGVQGLLVAPGDAEQLQQALLTILTDPALAEKMGKAGRQKVGEQFSSRTMVASIGQLYQELLKKKGLHLEH